LPEPRRRPEPRALAAGVVERFRAIVPARDETHRIERRLVEAALDALRLELDENPRHLLRDAEYRTGDFRADLELVWDNLENLIAPAERVRARTRPRNLGGRPVEGAWSDPIDWRSILDGGWFYWLSEETDRSPHVYHKEARDNDQERLGFNEHILGSIELSEIQRRALSLKGSLDVLHLDVLHHPPAGRDASR
jgi:hypothetical protein